MRRGVGRGRRALGQGRALRNARQRDRVRGAPGRRGKEEEDSVAGGESPLLRGTAGLAPADVVERQKPPRMTLSLDPTSAAKMVRVVPLRSPPVASRSVQQEASRRLSKAPGREPKGARPPCCRAETAEVSPVLAPFLEGSMADRGPNCPSGGRVATGKRFGTASQAGHVERSARRTRRRPHS